MSKKIKVPKVSKNPNRNWESNEIQFARFIAEAEAVGAFEDIAVFREMSDSMDLTFEEVSEIVDRAQKVWDDIKEQL